MLGRFGNARGSTDRRGIIAVALALLAASLAPSNAVLAQESTAVKQVAAGRCSARTIIGALRTDQMPSVIGCPAPVVVMAFREAKRPLRVDTGHDALSPMMAFNGTPDKPVLAQSPDADGSVIGIAPAISLVPPPDTRADTATTPTITVGPARGASGARLVFDVVAHPPATSNYVVHYEVAAGTARPGEDYVVPPGDTVTLSDGVSARIGIDTVANAFEGAPRTFTVTLSTIDGPQVASATGTIVPVATAQKPSFAIAANQDEVTAGQTIVATVTRTGTASRAIRIPYVIRDPSACAVRPQVRGMLRFFPTQSVALIRYPTCPGDPADEKRAIAIAITLANPGSVATLTTSSATVNVQPIEEPSLLRQVIALLTSSVAIITALAALAAAILIAVAVAVARIRRKRAERRSRAADHAVVQPTIVIAGRVDRTKTRLQGSAAPASAAFSIATRVSIDPPRMQEDGEVNRWH